MRRHVVTARDVFFRAHTEFDWKIRSDGCPDAIQNLERKAGSVVNGVAAIFVRSLV